ncbi:hypothetical protein ABPG74_009185 [Tetrahymena malaccensis]
MAEVETKYRSYWVSFLIMWIPYIVIYIAGYYLFEYYSKSIQNDLIRLLVVDLIATVIVFIFSYIFDNSSIYDPYWMVPTIGLVLYLNEVSPNRNSLNSILIMSPIIAYSIKHTVFYFRFWPGLKYEDFRYVEFSKKIKSKIIYWLFSFFGLHIMPTLMIYFAIIPTYYALRIPENLYSTTQNQLYIYGGVVMSWLGLIFETIADEQILPWRIKKSKEIILTGLWKYSRHPNYFGDMFVWIGMFLPCLVYGEEYYWTSFGAILILAIMNFYTLPAMERHLKSSRPEYAEYQKHVSRMIPWFTTYTPSKDKKTK